MTSLIQGVISMQSKYKINSARLMGRLRSLSKIGQNKAGGIDRQLASAADAEARKWLINCWKNELGLLVKIDPIANLWAEAAKNNTSQKPIVLGSHHDTVPNGGMFDGALGVLMATEVMRIALKFNELVREGKIGPVMIGRDHHDVSGTDSPFRETANIHAVIYGTKEWLL